MVGQYAHPTNLPKETRFCVISSKEAQRKTESDEPAFNSKKQI
jgi:hypothetical protein